MTDPASTRQALQVALEQETAQERGLRALLCLAGEDAALVALNWSPGTELTLNGVLPPERASADRAHRAVLAERLEHRGWQRLDKQTMFQDLTRTHQLPRDAADVVDRLVVALTDAYQVDVTGAVFTFEFSPPAMREQWRAIVERFTSRRRRV